MSALTFFDLTLIFPGFQNDRNKKLYEKYKSMANNEKNIHFLGRLASYKYFNMDQAIRNSLDYFNNYFEKEINPKSV